MFQLPLHMPQNQAQVNSLRTAVGIPKPRSEMYESILPYFATKSVFVWMGSIGTSSCAWYQTAAGRLEGKYKQAGSIFSRANSMFGATSKLRMQSWCEASTRPSAQPAAWDGWRNPHHTSRGSGCCWFTETAGQHHACSYCMSVLWGMYWTGHPGAWAGSSAAPWAPGMGFLLLLQLGNPVCALCEGETVSTVQLCAINKKSN